MSEEKKDVQSEEAKLESAGKVQEDKEAEVKEGKPAEEAPKEENKGDARMPKSTKKPNPGECAGCGKPIAKRLWYYRDLSFYCTKKCYKRKIESDRKKAEEEAAGAESKAE